MAARLEQRRRTGSRKGKGPRLTVTPPWWTRRPRKEQSALTENQLHVSVAEMLDWVLLPPALYTTFPAGVGKFSPALAGILKKRGMKPGMPDILLFYCSTCLGIELKRPGGKQSANQIGMESKLRAAGVPVAVCHSVDEVLNEIRQWGLPLRANVAEKSFRLPLSDPTSKASGTEKPGES